MLVRVQIVDPSSYTPPYDHALCAALGKQGIDVQLLASKFDYGDQPLPDGYSYEEFFYRHSVGSAGSKSRLLSKGLEHIPDMIRLRKHVKAADIVHFQWLSMQMVDQYLIPKSCPTILTAHDVLPREPRPGTVKAQKRLYDQVSAVIVHSQHGRSRLVDQVGIDPSKVTVIPHGAFEHLTKLPGGRSLPPELRDTDKPVVLFFGLLRPYKGVETLMESWRGVNGAELWVVGMPRMPVEHLREPADPSVKFVSRYVNDSELAAVFERADIVVLPYNEIDQSGVLYTALAFEKPMVLSDVGGFPEVAKSGAARVFKAGDIAALTDELTQLLASEQSRAELKQRAREAALGQYAWSSIAQQTAALYRQLLEHRA